MSGAGVAAAAAGAAISAGVAAATKPKTQKAQAAPEPQLTAQQQMDINRQGMALESANNRFQQYGPSGAVNWVNAGTAEHPSWVQNTTLSPENQKLYDSQMRTQNKLSRQSENYADKFYGKLQTKARPINYDTFNKVAQTQLDRMMPGLDHRTQMLTTDLANQGLAPGGEAYTNAMRTDSQMRNDANLAAINSAMVAQGQQESMANANEAQNNANQTQAITNMGGLISGSGTVDIPVFGGNTSVTNSGITPNMGQLTQNQYDTNNSNRIAQNNLNTASKNQIGGAAGQLGQAASGAAFNYFSPQASQARADNQFLYGK